MTDETRPIIAITIGDPAGIGPEVVVKAFPTKAFMTCAVLFSSGKAPPYARR